MTLIIALQQMIGTPLELIRQGLPSDCIFPSFRLNTIWVPNPSKFSIFHVNTAPMLNKFILLLIISMVEKDKFFRVKANILPKSKPCLILNFFVVLLNEVCFSNQDRRSLIYSLLILILFAASIHKAKYFHLIYAHLLFLIYLSLFNYKPIFLSDFLIKTQCFINSLITNKMVKKKIHLHPNEVQQKIKKLSQLIQTEQVKQNKTKRKRLYHQLAQLKKALEDPENNIIDPDEKLQKQRKEKEKRIMKKIQKKKEIILTAKKQKRYQKRCLKCGSRQHILGDCPTNKGGGFCYKCGSSDHNHKDCSKQSYSLADCFYCGQKGHIARQCPSNEKGLYRKGGSCFGCGSVRHTLKDCPVRNAPKGKIAVFKNDEQF